MLKVTISLKSLSPYTQSRQHHVPKLEKEAPDAYEERTWLEKTTTDAEGFVCIPAMAFKQALDRSAKMLGMQITGRGKATYTKHFLAGIMVPFDLRLPIRKSEVTRIAINANADGVRGSGKRVRRFFPQIPEWSGKLDAYVIDETITPAVFEKHMRTAGMLVGIGQYRPENGGTNGRFECLGFTWSDEV
jgi:hypothetical protein